MVKGHLVAHGGPELIPEIDREGFERFEAAETKVEASEKAGA